jgi:hypothetical protein
MTPTPDFRALCTELVAAVDEASDAVDRTSDCVYAANQPKLLAQCVDLIRRQDDLLSRARAALSAAPQIVESTTSVCGRRVTQVEAGNPPSEYVLTGQAEPQQGAPSDEAWQKFIEQLQQVQYVAQGEGQGPRFDLAEFAVTAWHYGAQAVAGEADSDVIRALVKAEAALADIGDAEREPGDDLAWCERRAAEALPVVRDVLAMVTKSEAQP